MHDQIKHYILMALGALCLTVVVFVTYHQMVTSLDLTHSLWFRVGGSSLLVFSLLLYVNNQKQSERVTKGTKMVTPEEFNRAIKGDGVFIPCLLQRPWYLHKVLPVSKKTIPLRIRSRDEPVHLLIVGDSGTGKSALQHTLLQQITARPVDRKAVYDPSMEFWEHHGRADRDLLLHPLEDNCPYWDLAAEIRTPLDAAALAKSFIPDSVEGKSDFWENAPRKILARLFLELKKQGKGTETLVRWLADRELIFDLVENTELEVMIDRNAHGQRSGVLASLVMISDALRLLPGNDGRPTFSFTEWSKHGTSSLYLGTRGVGEREGLRPLLSAWLDTMFARLMEHKGGVPTWCFVDELPSLQRLPSLKTALHEGRKYNLRFVLGFQGRAQIEQLYGKEAETLMSAPSTRVFLRCNEYSGAEWGAKNIGMPEWERDVESLTTPRGIITKGKSSVNLRTDKRTDYLVYPNEIQNLPNLTGYLRYDRYAVPITFSYPDLTR